MQLIGLIKSSRLLMIASFTIAFILGSKITIPFYPVPFTLQTMVFILAILYDKKIAFESTMVYLMLGAVGLPIFAVASSHTIGYLVGFGLGTFLVRYLNINNKWLAILLFEIVLFSCGVSWLAKFIGIKDAIHFGLLFFILPEIVKTLLAGQIYKLIK